MIKVKICGITNVEDAQAAVHLGADALGFIFYKKSPRFVSVEKAKQIVRSLPPFVCTVGVFVDDTDKNILQTAESCLLSLVQLHGNETSSFCKELNLRIIKTIRYSRREDLDLIPEYNVQGFLVDTFHPNQYGGTGVPLDWEELSGVGEERPIILSGGLTPENVREAIQIVAPYAVDVSSGVEERPGKKSAEKMHLFIQRAKQLK